MRSEQRYPGGEQEAQLSAPHSYPGPGNPCDHVRPKRHRNCKDRVRKDARVLAPYAASHNGAASRAAGRRTNRTHHGSDERTGTESNFAILYPLISASEIVNSILQALQIHGDAKKYTKATAVRSTCIYGGGFVQQQIGELKRGVEIVVCTPGRMIDVLTANNGKVRFLS